MILVKNLIITLNHTCEHSGGPLTVHRTPDIPARPANRSATWSMTGSLIHQPAHLSLAKPGRLSQPNPIRDHLVPSRTIWCNLAHLEPCGVIWCHLEPSGAIWCHLVQSCTIWDRLGLSEPSGAIWCHLVQSYAI